MTTHHSNHPTATTATATMPRHSSTRRRVAAGLALGVAAVTIPAALAGSSHAEEKEPTVRARAVACDGGCAITLADGDGDGASDLYEIATGHHPLDGRSVPEAEQTHRGLDAGLLARVTFGGESFVTVLSALPEAIDVSTQPDGTHLVTSTLVDSITGRTFAPSHHGIDVAGTGLDVGTLFTVGAHGVVLPKAPGSSTGPEFGSNKKDPGTISAEDEDEGEGGGEGPEGGEGEGGEGEGGTGGTTPTTAPGEGGEGGEEGGGVGGDGGTPSTLQPYCDAECKKQKQDSASGVIQTIIDLFSNAKCGANYTTCDGGKKYTDGDNAGAGTGVPATPPTAPDTPYVNPVPSDGAPQMLPPNDRWQPVANPNPDATPAPGTGAATAPKTPGNIDFDRNAPQPPVPQP